MEQRAEGRGISRRVMLQESLRNVLAIAVLGGLASSSRGALEVDEGIASHADTTPLVSSHHEGASASHDLPWYIDEATMGAVVGSFLYFVGWEGVKNGNELDANSASVMNAAALTRIGVLSGLGGESGKHLAHEEWHEILHGLTPVPILVVLSDITSAYLKVNDERIFNAVDGSLEAEGSYADIDRPGYRDGVEAWNEHLARVEADIKRKACQVCGITTVIAPIATTYASSSVSNSMKEKIAHMLYEQSYAQAIIGQMEEGASGEDLDLTSAREAALERSDRLMNGRFGYNKLMLTLSANSQGSWGIGDPPEIYFYLNHKDTPGALQLGHGLGAANAVAYSFGLTSEWLRRVGVFDPEAVFEIPKAAIDSAEEVLKTIFNPKQLAVSVARGGPLTGQRGFLRRVGERTEAGEELSEALRASLREIPQASFRFLPEQWAAEKLSFLKRFRADPLRHLVHEDGVASVAPETLQELSKAIGNQDERKMRGLLGEIRKALESDQAAQLAKGFRKLVEVDYHEVVHSEAEGAGGSQEGHAANPEIDQAVQRVQEVLAGASKGKPLDLIEQMIADSEERDPENKRLAERLQALSVTDRGTIEQALKRFTDLADQEDAIEGYDNPAHPHHKPKGMAALAEPVLDELQLSHSAREVLFALTTQIPAVPALSHLARKWIPKALGIDTAQKISKEQLKDLVTVLIPTETIMSGFADNVAAYLFSENVLKGFFESAFGDDIFERQPALLARLAVTCKLIAEQGGSLSKIGNGPNFTQDKIRFLATDENSQGVKLDRVSEEFAQTLPWNNGFSALANGSSIVAAVLYLRQLIDGIDENKTHAA